MDKVAIYCRESTEKQEIETLVSLCIEECKKLGFNNYRVFKDIKSGYSNEREEYLEMIEEIQAGRIKVLILYETSRLTRDEIEHHYAYRLFREYGVRLYVVNRGWINLNNDDDMFLASIFNSVDALEGRKTAKRVRDRLAELVRSGRWTGGPAPLGYNLINKELIVNEEDANKVREIFQLFLGGTTRMQIAKLFGFRDYKKVMRILENPVYIGRLKFREQERVNKKRIENKNYKTYKGKHEAIVSAEIFELTQQRLSTIKREVNHESYELKDLVYCSCGNKMYQHHKLSTVDGKVYENYVYHCKYNLDSCNTHSLKSEELVPFVLSELERVIEKIDFSEDVGERTKLEEDLKSCIKQAKECDIEEETLTRNLLKGILSQNIYEKLMEENKEKKKFYSTKQETLKRLINSQSARKQTGKIIKKYFKKIKKEKNPEKINQFLKLIVERIEFVNDFRIYIKLRL